MKSPDDIQVGAFVLDRLGKDVGTVEAIGTGYFVLARPSLFAKELFVPFSAVERADRATRVVRLTVDEDDLDQLEWDEPAEPSDGRLATTGESTGFLPN